jgi:uncharacterized protein (DUF488 family)
LASLLTIGHSDRDFEGLIWTLSQADVTAVADVRSSPYSGRVPQFNREVLQAALVRAGVSYLYLGDLIGGRPESPEMYDEQGRALYYKLATSEAFLSGVERLETGADDNSIAIMCSEGDPTECHRHLLIARVLVGRGSAVTHILRDDTLVDYWDITQPTLALNGEDTAWRSIRSVSPRSPQSSSSEF